MLPRGTRFALVLAALFAVATLSPSAHADPRTEITPGGPKVTPLKNMAMIQTSQWGYRYVAGQQNSHLVVSLVGSRVRFRDTGTARFRSLVRPCVEVKVRRGVAAECPVPAGYNASNPLFLEIWPRLGNDYINGSTLPAMFRMWVLADQGHDTVIGGAGDDFVNGASQRDKVWGGAGDDWLRTGRGGDRIWGQEGDDKVVGTGGHDQVRGGAGNDQVNGGAGNDRLWGDSGRDTVGCGSGADNAWIDSGDSAKGCESLTRG